MFRSLRAAANISPCSYGHSYSNCVKIFNNTLCFNCWNETLPMLCRKSLARKNSTSLWLSLKDKERNFNPVTHVDLDLDTLANNIDSIQSNLSRRGDTNTNLEVFSKAYKEFCTIKIMLRDHEKRHRRLLKEQNILGKDIEKLPSHSKQHIKYIKEEYAQYIKEYDKLNTLLDNIEEIVMTEALRFPVEIHSSVPDQSSEVDNESQYSSSNTRILNHIDLGIRNNLLECGDEELNQIYLKGPLHDLQTELEEDIEQLLVRSGYELVSPPAIVQPVLLEASGCDLSSSSNDFLRLQRSTLELHNLRERGVEADDAPLWADQSYLVGNGSFYSLLAFVMRANLSDKGLPKQLYTIGSTFRERSDISSTSLLNCWQMECVQTLFVAKSTEESYLNMCTLHEALQQFYRCLPLRSRHVILSASALSSSEACKIVHEVWLASIDKFVPCSHVTLHGDFVSRRLMSTHIKINSPSFIYDGYTSIMQARMVDIRVLLAALIESNQSDEGFVDADGIASHIRQLARDNLPTDP